MTDKPSESEIGYASPGTDDERDAHSFDRAMTIRLCRTYGWSLLVLGGLLTLLSLAVGRGRGVVVAVVVFFIPGIALLVCCVALAARKVVGAVGVLVVGVVLALVFGAVLVGVGAMVVFRAAPVGDALLQIAIAGVLLAGVLKLLYHDVRLLVAPGRGASEEAVSGLEYLFTADWNGVRRLGGLRVVSGLIGAGAAGAVLGMILLPDAPAPVAPVVVNPGLDPMVEVLPKSGLGAADRAVVIDHFEKYRKLDAVQREVLEDALQDVGKTLLDQAHWWKRFTPNPAPFPSLSLPLNEAEVAERLPIDVKRSDEFSAAKPGVRPEAAGLRIATGGLLWFWESDRGLWLRSERELGGLEGMVVFNGSATIRGDAWISGGLAGWSSGAITRLLKAASAELDRSGASGTGPRVTVSQARTAVEILQGVGAGPTMSDDAMPKLKVSATLGRDGELELSGTPTGSVWVERDGTRQSESPEAREKRLAAIPKPGIVSAKLVWGAVWMVLSLLSAALGVALVVTSLVAEEGRDERAQARGRALLLAAAITTILGTAAMIAVARALIDAEPSYRKWLWSPVGVVLMLCMTLWTIGVGVAAPVLVRGQGLGVED